MVVYSKHADEEVPTGAEDRSRRSASSFTLLELLEQYKRPCRFGKSRTCHAMKKASYYSSEDSVLLAMAGGTVSFLLSDSGALASTEGENVSC